MLENTAISVAAAWLLFILLSAAALVTHFFYCFMSILHASGDAVFKPLALMIGGLIFPPAGAVHGVLLWFGSGLL